MLYVVKCSSLWPANWSKHSHCGVGSWAVTAVCYWPPAQCSSSSGGRVSVKWTSWNTSGDRPGPGLYQPLVMPGIMNLDSVACARCEDGFEPKAKIVNCNGQLYCSGCFVCAQCFRQFPDGVFYEFEDRKYCEHCFHVLYAPCCAKCGEFIVGRVIKVRLSDIALKA